MAFRVPKSFFPVLVLVSDLLLSTTCSAQRPTPGPPTTGRPSENQDPSAVVRTLDIHIYVRGADGGLIDQTALVTLQTLTSQFFRQGTTEAGYIEFDGLPSGHYTIQAVAPGYEKGVKEVEAEAAGAAVVTVELRPVSDGNGAAPGLGIAVLTPKAQKGLNKALEALRADKPAEARSHLDAAYGLAPNHPEVNYLFGVYFAQMNDWVQAKSYWEKALSLYPNHVRSLLSLSEALFRQDKPADALPYLNRAVEADPSSWRAYALLAEAYYYRGSFVDSVKQAERALELGHDRASSVQPLLANSLAIQGDSERAVRVLQTYLRDHPADTAAQKQLSALQIQPVLPPASDSAPLPDLSLTPAARSFATALPLPSSWLPPDVDEKVPPVEPGVACSLDEVILNAAKRVEEFVRNVDRFTATESLFHESINPWGLASNPEIRKFDYLVSIEEVRNGMLNVEEYRDQGNSLSKFPDRIATNGLPALVLIFHPYNAGHYDITCEGLARWNGGLAWQVHFRQRTDKPNTMRSYKLGATGPSFPVALKGRAWIAADSYQIVRLETDMISPLPEIRLFADHAAIEYGPVHFRNRKVDMWLPHTAEVFCDWKGRRIHRRHSFSNYLLFSVDDKQRISAPRTDDASSAGLSPGVTKPNP